MTSVNDRELQIRLSQLAKLLHPEDQEARRVLADAIIAARPKDLLQRTDHRTSSRNSARRAAQREAELDVTRIAPKSNLRNSAAMDREWCLHLQVLMHSEMRFKSIAREDAPSNPPSVPDPHARVVRFFALLVQRSMAMQPAYAAYCIGKWVYGCKLRELFYTSGYGKNGYDSIERTIKGHIKEQFLDLPKLSDINTRDKVCEALERLLACLSPTSDTIHQPALAKLAELTRNLGKNKRGALVLNLIAQKTKLQWSANQQDVSLVLAGPWDYPPNQGLAGVHPEYLRSEVLVDPGREAFRYCLSSSKEVCRPRLPVWKMNSRDDSSTPPPHNSLPFSFDGPPQIDDAFLRALADEVNSRDERSRKYKYKPGAPLVFEVDGDLLVLEPDTEADAPCASWSAVIPEDASQLNVYGEDEQGRVLLGTVFLPDLQDVEPGQGLALAMGELNGPAFVFAVTEEAEPDKDPRYRLLIDFVAEWIAEPIILAECRLRACIDDPLLPWFDLVSPVYPYLTLRLQFDRKEGVVRLLSPSLVLPEIYCTDKQQAALREGRSTPDERHFVVALRDVPDLAAALGLPVSYRRWGHSTDAPTGKALLARLRGSVGKTAASLRLLQSAVLGAQITRGHADDLWTPLRELQALFPTAATRDVARRGGNANPWPSVVVALVAAESQDALTFVVVWTDPPKEPPKVEAFLGKAPLSATCERRGDRDLIHLPGPIPGLGDGSSLPDWELTWDWTPDVLTLRLNE